MRVAGRIVVVASGMFAGFAITGIVPVLPAIAAHFSATPGAGFLTRLLISVIGFAVSLGAPFAGALARRFGHRRMMLIAIVAFCVAGSAGFILDNLYAIVASRIIVGLATGIGAVVALALLVSRSTGLAHNRWFGYIHTCSIVSGLILLPVAGFLGRLGWNWPFLMYAALMPLAVLTVAGFAPDPPPIVSDPVGRQEGWIGATAARLATVPYGYFAIALTTGVIFVTPTLYIPFHLHDIGVVDPVMISLVMVPCSMLSACVAFSFGTLRKRFSIPAIFIFTCLSAAVGLIGMGLSQTYAQALGAQLIFSVGTGLFNPCIYAFAAATGPDADRARTLGLGKTGIYGGPLVGQALLEPAMGTVGAGGVIVLIAAIAVGLAAVEFWRSFGRRSVLASS
jgi:MFS family permease